MDKQRITLYLDEDLKVAIEQWAKAEQRSVNSLIVVEMTRLLEARYGGPGPKMPAFVSREVPR